MMRSSDILRRLHESLPGAALALLVAVAFTATMAVRPASALIIVPPEDPTVSEVDNQAQNRLEWTIHNPNPSSVGDIFGFAVAITGQPLITADTVNGWRYQTLESSGDWTSLMVSDGLVLGTRDLTWAQFSGLSLAAAFPGFTFGSNDRILGFFVDYTAPGGVITHATGDLPLLIGQPETQGGFFGLFPIGEGTPFIVVGTGGTITGTIPEPGTLAIFGLGLAGLGLVRRRRKA